ncbi:putative hydroxymethylglutaryl-CoA lyase, putative,3-hydroxy-3-methylglutarate-CoA lyase [Trypanosoma conorhini]|uniref:hydroxymethylglutaryl-CoA lyase n=1 Tax=Trypanosoma conorhini TaxID=83891 RepID=A0A3R7JV33_9TRYP|nr:putative hydroxymethylglutaryl-CoA lyase, putative,3-hydroxy-3-methylglutarate-CoA lyase [Trypanosoma conorhini]RNE97292.1 putative hydroxymethylglutaryl-CoA lyase, putative,3-hydroxy-3-methylglutarate-CoA lyase [Trypanosoma conorhini]
MLYSRFSLAPIRLVECPRDAMQGLSHFIPTAHKVRYLNALLKCGFYSVDCASFVSPRAVPQMRDSAEVLAGCNRALLRGENAPKLSVVVASQAGFKRAIETSILSTIGYPLSCCERFQELNTKKSIAVALDDITQMQNAVLDANAEMLSGIGLPLGVSKKKELVVYLSMAFGNPYGEDYSLDVVERLASQLVSIGVRTITLADTVGVSEPQMTFDLFKRLQNKFPEVSFGAHFHSNTATSKEKILAALEAGCERFDSALGGMGGCPFAKKDHLVGNVATETVLQALEERNLLPATIGRKQIKECVLLKQQIFGVTVKDMLLSQSLHDEKCFAQLCQEHFKLYDVDDNGMLDYEGFRSSMLGVFDELGCEAPSEEKIRSSFHKVDLQNLGRITVDAYMMGARRLLLKRLEFFSKLKCDKNCSYHRAIAA